MENVANVVPPQRRDLPVAADYALTVRGLLALPSLAGAEVAAGAAGLDTVVRWVNVMEVPDILPWVKPNELLLTTGFPLRHGGQGGTFDPSVVARLVDGLAERGVSALGVKTGRYLDELPPDMLDTAERHGFPVLVLPRGVAFDEVMSEVFTQLVDRQTWALDVADRLHRTLTALVLGGGDLPQIAAEVAALFDTAVLICSPDGRVQTTGGAEANSAALAALPLFDPSGRFRTEQVHAGLQDAPDATGGQLAVARVIAGGTDHGLIAAYGPNGGLGPVTVQALERAATVAALAITKQLAVSAVESKFRGDFLRDALNGVAGPPELVTEHCAQLGWDVDRPLAVIVARLDESSGPASVAGRTPMDRLTAAWEQVLRARDRAVPVVGFTHELVALVPAEPESVQRTVAELVSSVAGDRGGGRRSFSTGVSRVIGSIADLAAAYEQAGTAVRVGRRTHGPGAVAHFDGLGVHRVLSLVSDPGELRAFAAEVLGPLGADTPDALDLRGTLQELLDRNCNVAETARSLHFHYNTLRYRITKLETMIGPFTSDANLRLDVALALRVVQMRGL
ncbi:PucR family transcriptional regulator ligand-binding domain-containing protein [Jatrophihabitans cynanchi]|jgi:purine catabolism regulator|uniref:PucR family transcriptional regulator ligand-binding domain-containing protein n=1 Tax=Jatrophihabitans cynanchi TaxID=2944128 RepID=A0ABY7JXJ6_9ACTN|nr:PucR family transcriptional regulator [Jatrophihabitans sp. SB3-54]WAX57295.1 PucR family transcriptional regulator ligand-binding domain-containing protein [Jatrophihabitans sp. SB3-54]